MDQHRAVQRDAVPGAEGGPVPPVELVEFDPGGDDGGAGLDPIAQEHRKHGVGRHHQGVHVVALGGGEAAGGQAQPGGRDERDILVQVLLEKGMVTFHRRDAEPTRQRRPAIVRDEGGVDVQQIEAPARQRVTRPAQRPHPQDAILRVHRQDSGTGCG